MVKHLAWAVFTVISLLLFSLLLEQKRYKFGRLSGATQSETEIHVVVEVFTLS